ncbi:dihydrodipicolinate synthase family protein [Mesorhizobium sp. YR577]|uniref:dihydrodipicolinate synthase family protein n=1 Tax=Mesorhizobium sp. YR577 TaxID=1884373 RepID=UPI0008F0284F|nr:dihydrodipicolinate synthase family protein [Mesorhizobium sp. YR577]SFU11478.1 4-hydroxy-tetrahydrodipicolinate synthase [Mesorhizobium sp. YR577]
MSIERVRASLGGISGIHVTPYHADGSLNEDLLAKVVRRQTDAGIHNIVSGGNTGEFFSLTFDEVVRLQAVAFAAMEGSKSVRTAAVGRSLREALATAKLAINAGAEALMSHHPLDPFAAPQAQADYFVAIAEETAVPVVAYLRSDAIPVSEVVRIALHPNIAGIKFATPNLMHMAECIRATSDCAAVWVCGLAEGWAPAFYANGAKGFTSGLVNVDPERSLAIWTALEAGRYDEARGLIAPIAPFEAMRTKFNNGANVTVIKESLSLGGWDVGPVRLPGLPELSAKDREELGRILASIGHPVQTARAAE